MAETPQPKLVKFEVYRFRPETDEAEANTA